MDFIQCIAHPNLHWLILLIAVLAIIKFVVGWVRGSEFKSADRILMASFAGLLDLQVMYGIIILLWDGIIVGYGFSSYHVRHGFVMIVATIVAHLFLLWKNRSDKTRFRNNLFIILIVLVLISRGIFIIRSIPIVL